MSWQSWSIKIENDLDDITINGTILMSKSRIIVQGAPGGSTITGVLFFLFIAIVLVLVLVVVVVVVVVDVVW